MDCRTYFNLLARLREQISVYEKAHQKIASNAVKIGREKIELSNLPVELANPFFVFPVDVWDLIFSRLENISDINTFSTACPQFELVAHRLAKYWLFPAVFPLLTTYLSKHDILSCRLVCKRWSVHVDNYLAGDNIPESLQEQFLQCYLLQTAPEINLLTTQTNHPQPPILGKRLFICSSLDEDINNLSDIIKLSKQLVNNIGSSIHTLVCRLTFDNVRAYDAYNFFVQILVKCPQLKVLDIGVRRQGANAYSQLTHNLSGVPLPAHKSLEKFEGCLDMLVSMFERDIIVNYHRQLKSLKLYEFDPSQDYRYDWNNLEQLTLKGVASKEMLVDMQQLRAPKLTQLSLAFINCETKLSDLINLCNKFPNLTKLGLELRMKESLMINSNEQISEFSNVEKLFCSSVEIMELKMDYLCFIGSFDFLLLFPRLQALNIVVGTITEQALRLNCSIMNGEQINVKSELKLLFRSESDPPAIYLSNVWEKCKRLEKITVNGITYTKARRESLVNL